MDAALWWTAIGSAAAVAATLLAAWQLGFQVIDRRPRGPGRSGHGPGGLPVGVPLGRLPAEIRGRDALLAELRGSLPRRPARFPLARRPRPGRAWVLAGLGGLGKSTLALAAAQTARSRGWPVWWVTATDSTSLAGGMLEILHQLGAPDTVTDPVREGAPTAAERAWRFLNGPHPAGQRWLLIFDNADDPAVLAAPGSASPADHTGWLCPAPRGTVILTTRVMDPRTWGPGVCLRELQPLDEEAAAKVLTDLAPGVRDPGGREARELGRRLGGLPLALHLAGSYLASPFAQWRSFADYRRALDSVELPAALADLDDSAADARTAIQRTWDLSLDALAARGQPQARPLLLLLSCYAPAAPIPARVLRPELLTGLLAAGQPPAGPGEDTGTRAGQQLRSALTGLAKSGLIDVGGGQPGTQAVTVHPVVADVNRARLRTAARPGIGQAAVRLLRAACDELDGDSPADWPAWQELVPHLLALLQWLTGLLDQDTLAALLEVTSQAAEALVLSGYPGAAEKLARAGTGLTADHPARLAVRHALAAAHGEQGRVNEAERIFREVLADRERVLGHDDPDTLATRFELARVLGYDRFAHAEQLHREALDGQQRILGPLDRRTLTTRHWLGRLLMRFGRYEQAEQTYREVLDGRRQVLGDDHPDTMVTRHTLAWAIARQGRYAEAEQLFRRVIEDQRRIEGPVHPHVLGSGRALGWCLAMRGRHAEAEQQARQVLADQQQVRGEDHPATLETMHNLAYAIGAQGRHAEAEQLFRRVLGLRTRRHGKDHRNTLTTAHYLALVIAAQGRKAEARQMLEHVLARREQILGKQHPDTELTRQAIDRLDS